MTVKPHANIEECDREFGCNLAEAIQLISFDGRIHWDRPSMFQLIADFRAERERMVRLEEAQMWRQLKADLRPDSLFLEWVPERIAELEGGPER